MQLCALKEHEWLGLFMRRPASVRFSRYVSFAAGARCRQRGTRRRVIGSVRLHIGNCLLIFLFDNLQQVFEACMWYKHGFLKVCRRQVSKFGDQVSEFG